MSAPNPVFPFGLNSVVVTNIGGTSQAALPAGNRLMFKERIVSGEAKGDDKTQSVAAYADAAEWELEAAGISLEALAIITGRTLTTSGSSPNEVKTLTGDGSERMPYFKIYGKSLGEGDDDVHVKLFKCKVMDGLESTLELENHAMSNIKGLAVDDGVNGIWDVVINETAAALPSS